MIIDCHAHLADASFAEDISQVLVRARQAGVEHVLCVSEGPDDAARTLDLCAREPMLHPCLGLHPDRAERGRAEEIIQAIRRHADDLVAIGEVGLDYWVAQEEDARSLQREILKGFAALSLELGLPLNVHSRSAGHHVIALLHEAGARQVLLHAFDGKASYARAALELGYLFSIPPSVVRSPQKQKLVQALPLEALALETDSPVLGPDAGQRNEPANALLAARTIASIKGVGLDEVIRVTGSNALRLFTRLAVHSQSG